MASRTSGWTPALLSLAKLRVVLVRSCCIPEQCTRVDYQRQAVRLGHRCQTRSLRGPCEISTMVPGIFHGKHFARLFRQNKELAGCDLGCDWSYARLLQQRFAESTGQGARRNAGEGAGGSGDPD